MPFSDLYDGSRTRQLEMFQSDQPQFRSWLDARERKPTARLVIITSVEDWAKDQAEEDIYRQFCLDDVVKQLDIREPVVHAYSPNHAPMSATLDQLRQWNDVEVLLTMCVPVMCQVANSLSWYRFHPFDDVYSPGWDAQMMTMSRNLLRVRRAAH